MSFVDTWQTFCRTASTAGPSPGIREQWHQGRRWYAVWLLRVDSPAVHARMATVADALTPAVRPIPADQAHITLFVSGFVANVARHSDDVAEAVLSAQRTALALSARSMRLTVGGSNSFTTAAFLEVHDPDGGIAAARRVLAGEADELRFGPYHPHVTCGVYRDTRPTAPLVEALTPFRELPPIPLTPTAIELAVFDAHVEGSPLITRYQVPLRH